MSWSSSFHILKEMVSYIAHEKDIAIVNLFWRLNHIRWAKKRYNENPNNFWSRIWEVSVDDLNVLHLWVWRNLRTLSWKQLCFSFLYHLRVIYMGLQKFLIWWQSLSRRFSIGSLTDFGKTSLLYSFYEFVIKLVGIGVWEKAQNESVHCVYTINFCQQLLSKQYSINLFSYL